MVPGHRHPGGHPAGAGPQRQPAHRRLPTHPGAARAGGADPPPLRVPALHPPGPGLRHRPRHPLRRGRPDRDRQPRAAVPAAPPAQDPHPLAPSQAWRHVLRVDQPARTATYQLTAVPAGHPPAGTSTVCPGARRRHWHWHWHPKGSSHAAEAPCNVVHMNRPGRLALLCTTLAVAVAGSIVALVPATTAGAAPDQRPRRATYHNPLAPKVGDGTTVDSCADPTVLRGQRGRHAPWFMWCTSDPFNDEDVDQSGAPTFHQLPAMRSRDLVHWRYVGDALPTAPDWAAPDAHLWAPDVVYSRATDRYYLSFVVTDVDDSLRGPNACESSSDSAIGVAVSDRPTGPWRISDTPLVAPRPDPGAECAFFWTYDPD